MIRIFFGIFVAAFLIAFFGGISASERWTGGERILFWMVILDIVITAMAGGLSYFLFLLLEKKKSYNRWQVWRREDVFTR
jgi:hypothetical protein